MKKHIICIVITIFTALFCACCHAQQNVTYNIDIIPMSIVLPDSYIGLTRNISEDDKALELLGWSYEYAQDYMLNSDRYLNAVSFTDMTEMTVIVQSGEYDGFNISTLSDEVINAMLEAIGKDKSIGTASDYEVFKSNGIKFMKYFMEANNGMLYYQYSTTYNGYIISFTFSAFSINDKSRINNIANNIILNNVFFGDIDNLDSRITFKEEITGTEFKLPSGWDVIQDKSNGNLLAVFKPKVNRNNTYIHYDVYDILSDYSREDLIELINDGKSRKDYDFNYATKEKFNKQVLASVFGVEENLIKAQTVGNVNYYSIYSFDEHKAFNLKINSFTYMFFTISNGYLHLFTYGLSCDNDIADISQLDLSDFYSFLSGITFNIK